MGQQSLIYSFVARGTAILSEYTEFTGNFTSIASQCLQKLPSTNNKFTYNCDGLTFNYLVEDGFTYCVVAVESAGHQLPMAFLERIKEDFTKRYAGGKAATAVANSLNKEFGPKQKEQMQYCVDHPDGISKLAKVKGQVSEVKGVMMDNIEKDTIINKSEQKFLEGKGLQRFNTIYELCRSRQSLVVICCGIWEEVECLYNYLNGKELQVIRFHEELENDASAKKADIWILTGHLYDQWIIEQPFHLIFYNLPSTLEDYKRGIIRALGVCTFLNDDSSLNCLGDLISVVPEFGKHIYLKRTSSTVQRFQELLSQTKYKEAAELAAESFQGILRTPDTIAKFQSVPVQGGQTPPVLHYFGTLLSKGKLNGFESLELSRFVMNQNKKSLLENWLAEEKVQCVEELGDLVKNRNKKNLLLKWLHEEKLQCTEELGDLVKAMDNDLALKFYIKARATPKVVAALAERREFEKILIYSKQVGYTSDSLFILQTILTDPEIVHLLQHLATLLTNGRLNSFESLELSRVVVDQNKKHLLENWLAEDKLQCCEELGDLVKTVDNDLALKIYIKASATAKVVYAFAERKEFDMIFIHSKQVGYTPDYLFLLQTINRSDPQGAVNFALMMSQLEGGCPIDYNTITDLFLQRNLIREATTFLLDVLKPNLPEHAFLQTKVLEINLVNFPSVADAILANGMFSHYDRPRIAQLCEKAGLFVRALQHYAELPDIKRVIVNTHAIEPRSLVEFFGTLSKEWALECMELVLVYLRGNSQIIVLVAKEYSEKLGVDACIKLFEQYKSYEGLYFFLGSYLSSSEDPDIHFKYIEAAAKTGQIKEVVRVTRESNFYDAEKTKKFLMEAKLTDAQPLINVCDRFGFVPDLTHYLYTKNMLRYIKGYVQKVNPGNTPLVVGQLLDDDCPEDFIKDLILPVCDLLPVEPLVDACEKRNRLGLLAQFVEHLVSKGSQDVHVHNALGKIIIDSNNHPGHFLTTNPYYDSREVGKFCEKRDPALSVVAYRRGQCDDELVDVTNKNSLFNLQARYVVQRMDGDLWKKVLSAENEFRRQLIDEVVSDKLLQSESWEQFEATVNAFMDANIPHQLIADDDDGQGLMAVYGIYFHRIMR